MKNLLLVFHILLIFSIVGCADKGVYVGEKKDGKRHGKGTLTYTKKEKHKVTAKYEGEWKNGKKDGQGKFLYNMGDTYEGGFKNGKRHGQGTWEHPDGRKYVGEYKRGKWDGLGIITNKDGSKFDGELKRGRPFNGKGMIQGREDIQEGDWINGKMEGYGKMSNNSIKKWVKSYEGEIKNGKPNGQGKMMAKKIMTDDMARSPILSKLKGLTFIGEFKNGRPHNVKSFNDSGEQQSIIFNDGKLAGY